MAGVRLRVRNNYDEKRREIYAVRGKVQRGLRRWAGRSARTSRAGARMRAPVKKQGRIPRSLGQVEISHYQSPSGVRSGWSAKYTSRYIPAIVTNEGSGKYGDKRRPYKIQTRWGEFMHPGVRGTNWFGKAFDESVRPAEERFDLHIRRSIGLNIT